MSDVFLSYSSTDRAIAENIAADVKRLGLKIFLDQELLPGEEWEPRLAHELRRAKYVLVLLSPAYIRSPWARRELEEAILSESQGGPRIVPILVEGDLIPRLLRHKQYADLRKGYEAGMKEVARALTAKSEPSPEARERRWLKVVDLIGVLSSLFAAAISALSLKGVALAKLPTLAAVLAPAAALTALVGLITWYRSARRSRPLEVVARAVERAYVVALDESELNPVRAAEVKNG